MSIPRGWFYFPQDVVKELMENVAVNEEDVEIKAELLQQGKDAIQTLQDLECKAVEEGFING